MTFHCTASSPAWTTSQQHFTRNPTSATDTEQQQLDATKIIVTCSESSVKSGGCTEGTVDAVVGSVQHLLNLVFSKEIYQNTKLRLVTPLHLLCELWTHFLKSEMFYWPSSHLGNPTSCTSPAPTYHVSSTKSNTRCYQN